MLTKSFNSLEILLANRIATGLQRSSISRVSDWAETYRFVGKPFPGRWTFTHHPWAKEIHDCLGNIVGQKAAQMGFTECALNMAFKKIDLDGESVLYVLPASTPDANDFSTARFDPALEMSDHLAKLFSDVKNIGHKRAGQANLYIRGSRSRSQLKSIPVSFVVFDEVDEMNQDNIPLALERMSGQVEKQWFMISTPTVDGVGINAYYLTSTQEHFFFRCPHCSRLTELTFPDCLVITSDLPTAPELQDSHLICKECKTKLAHEEKIIFLKDGRWVPGFTNRDVRGFHIPQLYSATERPASIAKSFLLSQTNQADEQEFFNSKLGIPHVVAGAKLTDEQINDCIGTFTQIEKGEGRLYTLGVDVGKWLHYEIDEWILKSDSFTADINLLARPRVIKIGKVLNFEDIDNIIKIFKPKSVVVDSQPERRKAFELAQRFYGRIRLCFYGEGSANKIIKLSSAEEHSITVDRTSWLDLSLGRFNTHRITLPRDTPQEYKDQMKVLVRVYQKDRNGNTISRYVKGGDADHYAHARNYAEIALPLALGLATLEDAKNVY